MKWLLLRGLGREQRHWGSFKSQLENAVGPGNVFCLDLPGVGKNSFKRPPFSIEGNTRFLRACWLAERSKRAERDEKGMAACKSEERKGNEAWGILAMSLGGMIALDWLHRYPGDFSRAVLINTSIANFSTPWQRLRWKAIGQLLSSVGARRLEDRESAVFEMTCNRQDLKEPTVASWLEIARSQPVGIDVLLCQLWSASRFRFLKKPDCPLIFLTSEGDRMVSHECSIRAASALAASLEIHPSAGHDLSHDDPDWVIEKVTSFASSRD